MDAILIVGLVLFLVQFIAWFILPNSKKVSETSPEFSSIGDEVKTQVGAAKS